MEERKLVTVLFADITGSTTLGERFDPERWRVLLRPGVSLGDLVGGLNALGVTPQDLIAILQAIQTAGALQAELEIM